VAVAVLPLRRQRLPAAFAVPVAIAIFAGLAAKPGGCCRAIASEPRSQKCHWAIASGREWRLPPASTLNPTSLWGELLGFALAIAFSPLHLALLLLLLLGPDPGRRGSWLVASWLLVSALELGLLLILGHGLLLSMEMGSDHRTGLDLLAAGALLAVGLTELLSRSESAGRPSWAGKLDRLCTLPLPPLLALSALIQVVSPDDLFLYARAGSTLLAAGFERGWEIACGGLFAVATGSLLLVPLALLLLLGQERLQPWLLAGKSWLFARADLLVGLVSLALAIYLGAQGIEGLRQS
jgi:Sap, sulfolipid-1-addressing protein